MDIEQPAGTIQYLTFTLDSEEFALDITKVREVLDYTAITRVPHMPDYMRGVINLRGSVVPVIDLRMKLGMPAADSTINACIVIAEIALGDEIIHMGVLTDTVQEVIDLDPTQIQPPPRLGERTDTGFIHGIGKHDSRFIIILDIDAVMAGDELLLPGDLKAVAA